MTKISFDSLASEEYDEDVNSNREIGLEEIDSTNKPKISTSGLIDKLGFGKYQVYASMANGFYSGSIGASIILQSFALLEMSSGQDPSFQLSSTSKALLSSSFFASWALFASFWGTIADKYGRRPVLLAVNTLTLLSTILTTISPTFTVFFLVRAATGAVAAGGAGPVSLLAETCASADRGRHIMYMNFYWSLLSIIAVVLGYFAYIVMDSDWRMLGWLIACVHGLVLAFSFFLVEESAVWLMENANDRPKAELILKKYAKAANTSSELIDTMDGSLKWRLVKASSLEGNETGAHTGRPTEMSGLLMAEEEEEDDEDPEAVLTTNNSSNNTESSSPTSSNSSLGAIGRHIESGVNLNNTDSLWSKLLTSLGPFKRLLEPDLRLTTYLILLIFFIDSLVYYGIFLYVVELFGSESGGEGEGGEPDPLAGVKALHSQDFYVNELISQCGEAPGLILGLIAQEYLGRKGGQGWLFIVTAVFTLCFVVEMPTSLLAGFSAIARMAILGAFGISYVYAPEAFPTEVRGLAVGLCNGVSKLGGFITPAIVYSGKFLPIFIFSGASLVAAIAAFSLPKETAPRFVKRAKEAAEAAAEDARLRSPIKQATSTRDIDIDASSSPTAFLITNSQSPS